MSAIRRRSLQIDDPLAAGTAPDADRGSSIAGDGGRRADGFGTSRSSRSARTPTSRASASRSRRLRRWPSRSASAACFSRSSSAPSQDGYEVVAGERRWRAAELAGEATIPALIDDARRRRRIAGARADRERRPREPHADRAGDERSPPCSTTSGSPPASWRSDSAAAAQTSRTPSVCSSYPTRRSS